jgi:hypothetical protein
MSDQITSVPSPLTSSTNGISPRTLVLSVLLAVAITAAAVLGVVAYRGGFGRSNDPGPSDPSTTPTLVKDGDVYVQKAAVKPDGATGHVVFPMPYAVPPHLTLTSGKRKYTIVKEDELGFSWIAADLVDDFMDDVRKVNEAAFVDGKVRGDKDAKDVLREVERVVGKKKRDHIDYESFTWEARGLRLGAADAAITNTRTLFEQEGSFRVVPGETGDVNFPFPYALPPNVEVTGGGVDYVVITETKPGGFKWKYSQKGAFSYEMKWKTKGIKATTLPK